MIRKKEKPDEKSSKEKRRCIIRKEMGDSSEDETGDSDNTENADDTENSDGVESADKTKKDEESSRKSSDSKSNKNDSDNKASKTNETGLIDKEEYTVTKDDIERIKKEVSILFILRRLTSCLRSLVNKSERRLPHGKY